MALKIIFITILLAVVGVGSYYIGFNSGREKEILAKKNEIAAIKKRLSEDQNSNATASSKDKVKGAETTDSNQPNQVAYQEYTVQENDTLFTIGLKFNILWTHIAKANGIDENTPLFVGQKLKIPISQSTSESSSPSRNIIKPEIDAELALTQQQQLNEKNIDPWRKDPVEVVRREAPKELNLLPGDTYAVVAKDTQKGTATVFLQKTDKSYTFSLIQPADKGDNGIWKIEQILIKDE